LSGTFPTSSGDSEEQAMSSIPMQIIKQKFRTYVILEHFTIRYLHAVFAKRNSLLQYL